MFLSIFIKKRNPNSTHSQRNTPLLFFPAHGKIIAWAGKNKSMGKYIIICNNVIQQTTASHTQTFYLLLHTLVTFSTLAKQVTRLFYISLQDLMIQCKNILLSNFTRITRSTNISNCLFCQCRNIRFGNTQIRKYQIRKMRKQLKNLL